MSSEDGKKAEEGVRAGYTQTHCYLYTKTRRPNHKDREETRGKIASSNFSKSRPVFMSAGDLFVYCLLVDRGRLGFVRNRRISPPRITKQSR